jgi:hypothetical protein
VVAVVAEGKVVVGGHGETGQSGCPAVPPDRVLVERLSFARNSSGKSASCGGVIACSANRICQLSRSWRIILSIRGRARTFGCRRSHDSRALAIESRTHSTRLCCLAPTPRAAPSLTRTIELDWL